MYWLWIYSLKQIKSQHAQAFGEILLDHMLWQMFCDILTNVHWKNETTHFTCFWMELTEGGYLWKGKQNLKFDRKTIRQTAKMSFFTIVKLQKHFSYYYNDQLYEFVSLAVLKVAYKICKAFQSYCEWEFKSLLCDWVIP